MNFTTNFPYATIFKVNRPFYNLHYHGNCRFFIAQYLCIGGDIAILIFGLSTKNGEGIKVVTGTLLVIMFGGASSLWDNKHYREQIINIGNNDSEFIRFVNMLMNDTTFLLDEAISSLKRIHEIQEMKKTEGWTSKSQEQKDEIEKEFTQIGTGN